MDASIEMKLLAIDRMIDMRKQLIAMQDNLGMSNGLSADEKILVYHLEDLLELSKAIGTEVHETGYISERGYTEVAFEYKGVTFNTYILSEEYELYKNEKGRGNSNE